ncbi:hypothetical protein A4A49_07190 [Nicotiana attenuata]|uniref:Uncharacterized protein n=1 Tax=Nicotiana attenuata TaxID=49451 RepID=A0A1J6IG30_NICAT|nr:hypothetical protein A4A49_07190 [Nicotiana attenuata]
MPPSTSLTKLPSPNDQQSFSIPMAAHHYPPCDKTLPLVNPTPIIHNETSHNNTTPEPPINLLNPNITIATTKPCNAKTLVHNLQRKPPDQSPPLSLPTSNNERATPSTTQNSTDLDIPNTTSGISSPIMVRDGATGILPNIHTGTQQPGDHTPRQKSNSSGGNCNRGDEVGDGGSESAPMDQHLHSPTVGTHNAININSVCMGSSDFPNSIQLPPSHRSTPFLPTTPQRDDLCPMVSTHELILTPNTKSVSNDCPGTNITFTQPTTSYSSITKHTRRENKARTGSNNGRDEGNTNRVHLAKGILSLQPKGAVCKKVHTEMPSRTHIMQCKFSGKSKPPGGEILHGGNPIIEAEPSNTPDQSSSTGSHD